jgi:choice-of-anchor C domain-containing protein
MVDLTPGYYWEPAEGQQSVDLDGTCGAGVIYQDLNTSVSQTYSLRFALAGNPDGAPTIKEMEVWWGNSLVDRLTFDTTGRTRTSMGWGLHEYVVTATEASTRLRFKSLTPGCFGPVLDKVSVQDNPPWTVMYYLDGDTTYADAASGESKPLDRDYTLPIFDELRKNAGNPSVNIVALLDRYGDGNSAYYLIDPTTDPLDPASLVQGVNYWPQAEVNMGDPQTLANFGAWGRSHFPADNYALILSDHGSGLGGAMWDSTSADDRLSVKELGNALSTITNDGASPLAVLYMDACLMAMLEDAYQFRNYVHFYVASENTKQGYVAPHGLAISAITSSSTPVEVAMQFASTYAASGANGDALYTMSVLDLQQIGPVLDATRALSQQLDSRMPTNYQSLSAILNIVQTFDQNDDNVLNAADDYRDLYDFATLVKSFYFDAEVISAAQNVIDAVDSFVAFEAHQEPGRAEGVESSHGIAIYFPGRPSSFYSHLNYDFAEGVDWSIFGRQEASALSAFGQGNDPVLWGNMLISYVQYANPNGEDIPLPPDPVPPTVFTHTVSGNAGANDTTVDFQLGFTIADENGDYSFEVPDNWSGRVTPSKDGYFFLPDHIEYFDVTVDQFGQNYAATPCYLLTLGHAGSGADPMANPAHSSGCPNGTYAPGELIGLTASPSTGWDVGSWTGTDDDTSTAGTNTLTMPASEHSVMVAYVDNTAPAMTSLVRLNANPTSARSIQFRLTFSEPVQDVDTGDFSLRATGLTGTAITGLSGSGTTYTVTVRTGNGNGTLRLDIPASASISDLAGNPLNGLPFTSGEAYTINRRLTVASARAYDGWILESTETSGTGGILNATARTFRLGDDAQDRQYRSILVFTTGSLPDNAIITKVTLKIKHYSIVSTDPLSTHGNLLVDVRRGSFSGNPALQLDDFKAVASLNNVGSIPGMPVSGWYAKTWTGRILDYINRTGLTQLRLRFTTDDNDDLGADYLNLYSGNAVSSNRPQLIIEYYVP